MPAVISDSPVLSPRELRFRIRHGQITASTSGLARTVQANLLVLPSRYAKDFRNLCKRNPVPCPLLECIPAGTFSSKLAAGSDVRTDIPAYNVFVDGELVHHAKPDILDEWTDDHVGFLIGCSYSFETALKENGLEPLCSKMNKAVPMYMTNISLNPAGVFSGHYVVSMRSYHPDDIPRVREITSEFISQHGEPIAWGWEGAEKIGVKDKILRRVADFGDFVEILPGEVPVFWACGVTPQLAVRESGVEGIVMSHLPGSMFITDVDPSDDSFML